MNLYQYSVYTIVHSMKISNALLSNKVLTFNENRQWKTVEQWFNDAKMKDEKIPVILAKGDYIDGLYVWGILKDIRIADKKTEVSVDTIARFSGKQPLSKLKLISTKQSLSDDYIRPYALVYTDINLLTKITKEKPEVGCSFDNKDPPGRIKSEIVRIIRDTRKTKELKRIYKHKCQVCGNSIRIGSQQYSEVHHIRPLGGIHKGLDNEDNMIVLCPNHHTLFDYGVPSFISKTCVRIENMDFKLSVKHEIAEENIRYYEDNIKI